MRTFSKRCTSNSTFPRYADLLSLYAAVRPARPLPTTATFTIRGILQIGHYRSVNIMKRRSKRGDCGSGDAFEGSPRSKDDRSHTTSSIGLPCQAEISINTKAGYIDEGTGNHAATLLRFSPRSCSTDCSRDRERRLSFCLLSSSLHLSLLGDGDLDLLLSYLSLSSYRLPFPLSLSRSHPLSRSRSSRLRSSFQSRARSSPPLGLLRSLSPPSRFRHDDPRSSVRSSPFLPHCLEPTVAAPVLLAPVPIR
ncbi:unnamed protein product, partial [Somion occarium]